MWPIKTPIDLRQVYQTGEKFFRSLYWSTIARAPVDSNFSIILAILNASLCSSFSCLFSAVSPHASSLFLFNTVFIPFNFNFYRSKFHPVNSVADFMLMVSACCPHHPADAFKLLAIRSIRSFIDAPISVAMSTREVNGYRGSNSRPAQASMRDTPDSSSTTF